jgi:hypothetical protein
MFKLVMARVTGEATVLVSVTHDGKVTTDAAVGSDVYDAMAEAIGRVTCCRLDVGSLALKSLPEGGYEAILSLGTDGEGGGRWLANASSCSPCPIEAIAAAMVDGVNRRVAYLAEVN